MASGGRLDFDALLSGVRRVEEIIQYRDGHLVRERKASSRYDGSTTSSATSTAWPEGFEPDFAAEWNDIRPDSNTKHDNLRPDKHKPEWWLQRPQIVCDEAEYHHHREPSSGRQRQSKQNGLEDTSRDSAIALGMQQHEYDQLEQAQRSHEVRRDSAFALQEQQCEYDQHVEEAPRERDRIWSKTRQDSPIAVQEQEYEYEQRDRIQPTREARRDSAMALQEQQHEYDQHVNEAPQDQNQAWSEEKVDEYNSGQNHHRRPSSHNSHHQERTQRGHQNRRDSAIALELQEREYDDMWRKEKVDEYNSGHDRRASSYYGSRAPPSRRSSHDHLTPGSGHSRYSTFALPEEVPPPPYSPPRRRSSAITQETKEEAYGQRAFKPKKQIRAKEYEQQLRWLAGRRSLRRG